MNGFRFCSTIVLSATALGCAQLDKTNRGDPVIPPTDFEIHAGKPVADDPREVHLRNLRQLTFGGENAEAYWSFDGTRLVMQSRQSMTDGDQIYTVDLATGETRRISPGVARTTCAYFLQGDDEIIFASTHGSGPQVPHVKRGKDGYVWGIFSDYDIWVADLEGKHLRRLTDTPGYDAEATVCPVTGRVVFTSVRDGDLELYSMEPDGSDVKRLTNRLGYDGGAFYSHDGSKIVQRSGFPETQEEIDEYQSLLRRGLVRPSRMEITVIDRDGSNFHQVTNNGKANFAPYWHPDNHRILFSSNMDSESGRNFDIYMVNEDGSGLERITYSDVFDGFPMFSPNGK
ncbi:MAG: PD40 domain-containing protein, partial [Planctomycetes bacterium]|nr:PD40 domain-containing protein [Planctomycetota bacterium]